MIMGIVRVLEVSKKAQERRLNYFGHVMRKEDVFVCKRVMNMEVGGRRRKGRPKFRWKDNIAKDLKEKVLSEQDTQDRIRWRRLTSKGDPI